MAQMHDYYKQLTFMYINLFEHIKNFKTAPIGCYSMMHGAAELI